MFPHQLGILLGIFTLIVLMRPTVKELFKGRGTLSPLQPAQTISPTVQISRFLVLVGSFLRPRTRSPIVLVLELVLVLGICQSRAEISNINYSRGGPARRETVNSQR
jgi:hypothetical protein